MKKIISILFLLTIITELCISQGVASYTVTRQTGITYSSISTTGISIPTWRAGSNDNDNRSMPIPLTFTFNYLGMPYTTVSVCTNGFIDFSSSSADGNTPGAYSNDNTTFSQPSPNGTLLALAPFYEDIMCSAGTTLANSIKYKISGSAGSKVFTVEWKNMTYSSSSPQYVNFQVKLYEANARIEFIYGSMMAAGVTLDYTCGMNASTMSAPPTTAQLLTQQSPNTATFGATPQNALGVVPQSNSMLVFTACPIPFPAGDIVGSSNICENSTQVTYSVPSIGYATGYNWVLPAGFTIVSGANTNAIAVNVATGASSGSITVNGTNFCGNGTASTKTLTVSSRPNITLSGPATACQGITGNVYATQTGMTGYQWSVTGGTITAGGTSSSDTATVTWNTPGSQSISVNYTETNGCNAIAAVSFPVMVNPLPIPVITGPDSVCSGATGNIYSTDAGASNYVWAVSAGGTITAGGTSTSNTVTVKWDTAGAQSVGVVYTNSNGCAANPSVIYAVTVNPLPAPTITGPAAACVLSSGNIYTTQDGMTDYLWTITSGGTITSGLGSNAITVIWDSIGTANITVNYVNQDGCSAGTPTIKTVMVNPLPVPTISGNINPCVNSGNYPYTTETGMSGYTWSVSPGGIISSGAGTYKINVSWIGVGTQWVSVNYTNTFTCTAATAAIDTVEVFPLPGAVGAITGEQVFCGAADNIAYSVAPVTDATNYAWNLPQGAAIAFGAGTPAITVNYAPNAASGEITVFATNSCGAGPQSPPLPIQFTPIPETPVISRAGDLLISSVINYNQWYHNGSAIPGATSQYYPATDTGTYWDQASVNNCASDTSNHIYVDVITGIVDVDPGFNISVFPVPNDGKFTLSSSESLKGEVEFTIFNMLGIPVYSGYYNPEHGALLKTIDLTPIAGGIYSMLIKTRNKNVVKKIIINR